MNAYEWFDHGALLEAFCSGAGLPKLSAQPQVYLKDEHRRAVNALELPPHYCVIHRESNLISKDWPDEKWLALVRFLVHTLKIPVVEVGAAKKQVKATAGVHSGDLNGSVWQSLIIDLINRTSPLETAEVIRRACFFIGIDSGPAHLANEVKTPGNILLGRIGYFRQYTQFTRLLFQFYSGGQTGAHFNWPGS